MAHSEALLHPSATALLRRYEASWADIAQRNTSVCSRSREIAGDVAKANARAGEASAAWGQFRAELQALPQFALQMRELASSVADACARIDALEHRLHDAALARAEQDEGRWRQGQVEALSCEQQQQEVEQRERARLVAAEAEATDLARALEPSRMKAVGGKGRSNWWLRKPRRPSLRARSSASRSFRRSSRRSANTCGSTESWVPSHFAAQRSRNK